jgi:hypothetical protein
MPSNGPIMHNEPIETNGAGDGQINDHHQANPNDDRVIAEWMAAKFSLELRESSITGAGRGLFASRTLQLGEEIVTSLNPFVSVVTKQKLSTVCHNCFRVIRVEDENLKLKHCSTCKKVHYCSFLCQKEDWSIHKRECAIIREQRGSELVDLFRLMIRFLSRWHLRIQQSGLKNVDLMIIRILESRKYLIYLVYPTLHPFKCATISGLTPFFFWNTHSLPRQGPIHGGKIIAFFPYD